MGYFPNGTSADCYQADYCDRCIHDLGGGCRVWLAHLLHNYDDCNNPKSILHLLIPRAEDGSNQECTMFVEREYQRCPVCDGTVDDFRCRKCGRTFQLSEIL